MIVVIKIVELLAPSKDFACLNAAISNGADSIYIGIEGYNMRANVVNFKLEEVKKAVNLCHDQGVRLYICTNTIMTDEDIGSLKKLFPILNSLEIDAVILSDLGALRIANNNCLDVHMSVQTNLSNAESLNFLKDYGVKRAVLSRELSLEQIKNIISKTDMEIEVFIHGAMCMAVSGRCFLSSYFYDKSANCGECLQPCRKEWRLISEDSNQIIIDGNKNSTHFFSPNDLCMIEHVPELVEAGIHAFKIEGRARPADYVSTVTRVYHEALKQNKKGWKFKDEWLDDLKKVYNRGFDTGFYFKSPHLKSSYNKSTHIKKDIGVVENYFPRVSAAQIRLWDDITKGDEILIQGRTTGLLVQKAVSMQVDGKPIDQGFKGDRIGLEVIEKVRKNDVVFRRIPR
ncbi:MAG: peptidase U32 family protein [Methanobacteriaceae archaeon]|nr:peptidase U32 family protein [Methanobacteriaceae archaeon]